MDKCTAQVERNLRGLIMMADNFTTIDEYILGFDQAKQEILENIRKIIHETVPRATETINYKMPTFRLNGNVIHFAMFKNHVGIYPGAETIEHFQNNLTDYKTSKGAIQLPLDKVLPKKLLREIVLYKVSLMKDQKAEEWTKYNGNWAEANEKIQQVVNETELVKEFKWGGDIYTFNKKNVLAFSGFKNHFALWFHNGVFLKDQYKVLVNANEEKTKALRQWRFNSADEIDVEKVREYVLEAIQLVKDGKEIKPQKSVPKEVDGILKETLNQNNKLFTSFKALTSGRQKEYIEYIDEAKQEKTKISRIEKIKPMILEGKGLNDKYRK
ncbi:MULTISPECIES: DUF1801 domain-containing protein [unclassified Empedobacter]|uniref:DUF1801 domain-containing protein n=1 Tax=unclassified Empedobacter TaxID=2643773 RepID=UPI00244940A6|nr:MULTISPECIES: DUF1801 domain-containing protein [unclassified Empedobacter]MDH0658047.1 DUF1801 domain-containing protein [Empedobacter sp. GD03865]MDH1601858.1 DUF1801 domain-containing protein [Empedobacter sp. GD03739]